MGRFLVTEKLHQSAFKQDARFFSEGARADGQYGKHKYPFVLPAEYARENLFSGIRDSARGFFAKHEIKWHQGQGADPNPHLCSSQVACVNFLFPFAHEPEALADLLRPYFPTLRRMLPIEDDQFVSFEWIGAVDYLKERAGHKNDGRSRGALCTSADAVVRFEREDESVQVVLIEWKYTETYGKTAKHEGASGTRRLDTYQALLQNEAMPLVKRTDYSVLYYEPFYQFMRQQLLAYKMEEAHECEAAVVSVLHIAPAANIGFQRVTAPALVGTAATATDAWAKLVKNPDRFFSVSTEALFGPLAETPDRLPDGWWDYLSQRYPWVLG